MNFLKRIQKLVRTRLDPFSEQIFLLQRRICHSAKQLSAARFSSSDVPSLSKPTGPSGEDPAIRIM